jgi:hypothetical protein
MKSKFWRIFLSFILIAHGIQVILNPKFFDTKYGMFHDFSAIKWPYGGTLIFIGIIINAIPLFKKK